MTVKQPAPRPGTPTTLTESDPIMPIVDTLSVLAKAIADNRMTTQLSLIIAGKPVPETEQEWLLFNLNQGLRNRGWQKPLDVEEMTDAEVEAAMNRMGIFMDTGHAHFGTGHAGTNFAGEPDTQ